MSGSTRRLITVQVLGTAGLEGIGQLVSFLGVVVYASLAPKAVLGSYFLLYAIVRIGSFVGTTGISTDVTRRISRTSKPERRLSTATAFVIFVALLLTVVAYVGQSLVDTYVGNGMGVGAVLLLPPSVFALFLGAILRGEKKNVRAQSLVTVQKLVTYAAGISGLVTGIDPALSLVGGLFVGKVVEVVGGIVVVEVRPSRFPSAHEFRELLEVVGHLTVAGLGNLGLQWIDTLLIGALMAPEFVAVYEIAWRLSSLGLVITNAITSVLYPRFSEAVESDDTANVVALGRKAFVYVGTPMIALIAGAAALGPPLVSALYGPAYLTAFGPLLILLVARIPYGFSRIATVISFSYDKDLLVSRTSAISAVTNALANLLLIPVLGIAGAAIGSFLSYTLMAVLLLKFSSEHLDLYPTVAQFLPSIAAGLLMYACIAAVTGYLGTSILDLLLLVCTGALLYSIGLLLLSPTTRSDVVGFLNSGAIGRSNRQ